MRPNWLTREWKEHSFAWLLLTAVVAVGSSWLTFELVKRAEIEATLRAELSKQSENLRLVAERDRDERIRVETLRWANPILNAQRALSGRLDNILDDAGHLALNKDYERSVNPNWSISYDYFMGSTLFLFAEYFAWIEMFRQELSFELFQSQKEKDQLVEKINAVQGALSAFPPSYECSGEDAQVFALQQRALGDLLRNTAEAKTLSITFVGFQQNLNSDQYQRHVEPLRKLLENLAPSKDCRWKRLVTLRTKLQDLQLTCEQLLRGTYPETETPLSGNTSSKPKEPVKDE